MTVSRLVENVDFKNDIVILMWEVFKAIAITATILFLAIVSVLIILDIIKKK